MNSFFQNTIDLAEQAVKTGKVPSLCIAFGCRDTVLDTACFGKTSILEDACPVDETTKYDMASLTKLIAPTMISLRFLSRGLIDLTDTLEYYWGNMVPADKKEITIFHLMTHTAGFLPSVRMDKLFTDPQRVLPYLFNCPLQSAPGTHVSYSCLGYIVLGKTLEKISGKTLDILAKEEVFDPLEMKDTAYHPLNRPIDVSNTAYTEKSSFDDDWLVGRVHDENAFLLGGVSGNAGVFSTLNDCIHFARMLAMEGSYSGHVYLPSSILRVAMSDQTPWSDDHKGLGFDLSANWNSICGHFFGKMPAGHTGFTGTTLYMDPDTGLWTVMLSNRVHPTRENGNMPRIRHTVMTSLRSEFDTWEKYHAYTD